MNIYGAPTSIRYIQHKNGHHYPVIVSYSARSAALREVERLREDRNISDIRILGE